MVRQLGIRENEREENEERENVKEGGESKYERTREIEMKVK